ncbi:arginine--tRNA ligase [Thalassobacillus sp. CUG 92003]|uniref:arginine--tRNA ligase n=1 Tax=Thalassobacillus sp. CUG 92003 TaxID=2736641 RepID=UPI0015E64025|nr:arginine--tRNA ligase [Thalassobacillus sp. CUG 92003]
MEKKILALQLTHILGEDFPRDWVEGLLEVPKQPQLGDLAFPCFQLAKSFQTSPAIIAKDLAAKLKHDIIAHVEPAGGYVNIFLNQRFITQHTLKEILSEQQSFGNQTFGNGQTVLLDMSAPNIAKPFSMGHLRSTVIGNALANLAEKCGYQTVKINYLGDYGTQFGKLLAAYKLWGDEEKVRENTIEELTKLYVTFHEQAQQDESLVDEGREWFKKLENQDEEAIALWQWFKDESLEAFDTIYELLGITFDSMRGEAYYTDKMEATVHLLNERNLLQTSEGAQVVKLEEENLPPCLIKKSNGTTIYATRDLTAAIDRYNTYQFDEALYVVGNEQSLHFQQIKLVLDKLGFEWAKDVKHIGFGMMLQSGKKMSTRQGKTILLEDVLHEAINTAETSIHEKNPTLQNKREVARQVGVGAVIFHDLKHDRRNDVEFSLQDMLTFEGDTAPYLQYAYARAFSLLRKGEFDRSQADIDWHDSQAWPVIKQLRAFPEVIAQAYTRYDPSKLARYLLDVAQAFNTYYAHTRILDKEQATARLTLVYSFTIVMKEGLSVLGIQAPSEM